MPRPRPNHAGKKFGSLTVLGEAPKGPYSTQPFWECVCDCGMHLARVPSSTLRKGKRASCGKCKIHSVAIKTYQPFKTQDEMFLENLGGRPKLKTLRPFAAPLPPLTPVALPEGSRRKDLTGMKFGRWTVLGASAEKPFHWVARCSCGKLKELNAGTLTSASSLSCGCARRDMLILMNALPPPEEPHLANTPHNPLYGIWLGIKTRCFNRNNPTFARYGAIGITMDPVWRKKFREFAKAVGPRPTPYHTIDRIDNQGSYVPGNVRWATKAEQAENTRANPFVVYQGQEFRIRTLADHLGLPRAMLHHYAVVKENPLDKAIEICEAAMKVLTRTATPEETKLVADSAVAAYAQQNKWFDTKPRTSFIDLTNRQLGPWTVLAYVGKAGKTYPTEWLCMDKNGVRRVLKYTDLKDLPWLNEPDDLPDNKVFTPPPPTEYHATQPTQYPAPQPTQYPAAQPAQSWL